MNWIKVRQDIKPDLPVGTQLLIKTIHDGVKSVEVVEGIYNNEFIVAETLPSIVGVRVYGLVEYSHYCVITPPKPNTLTDLVKSKLEDCRHELDKWDGRKEITYNDTTFNAASVNYGKIESLEYILDLLNSCND